MVKKGKGIVYAFPAEEYARILEELNVKEVDWLFTVLMGEEGRRTTPELHTVARERRDESGCVGPLRY